MKTISIVTSSTSSSWNSAQAALYQRVVHPAGSHVPSQRVAKEETTTDAIMPKTLTTKNAISAAIAVDQSLSPSERRGAGAATALTLSSRRRGRDRRRRAGRARRRQ